MNLLTVRLISVDVRVGSVDHDHYQLQDSSVDLILGTRRRRVGKSMPLYRNAEEEALPDLWQGKVDEVYVCRQQEIGDYHSSIGIADLRPGVLTDLLALDADLCVLEQLDAFAATILPQWAGERACGRVANSSQFAHLVYLEPEWPVQIDDDKSLIRAANAVQSKLDGRVYGAHFFLDSLLFGWWGLPTDWAVLAACELAELDLDWPAVVMPITMWWVLEYLMFTRILNHMSRRLEGHPLHAMLFDDYLGRVGCSRQALGSERQLKAARNLLRGYEKQFLSDRQEVATLISRTGAADAQMRHALERNWLSLLDKVDWSVQVTPDRSYLHRMLDEFAGAADRYHGTAKLIEARAVAVGDFLRDFTTTISTQANLRLQLSIRRLTSLGIILTFLVLALGIMEILKVLGIL